METNNYFLHVAKCVFCACAFKEKLFVGLLHTDPYYRGNQQKVLHKLLDIRKIFYVMHVFYTGVKLGLSY